MDADTQLGVLCTGSVCSGDGSTFGVYINRMLIIYFFHARRTAICTNGDLMQQGKSKEVVSGWIVRIIQLTLTIQYTASGFCKMNGDWLA